MKPPQEVTAQQKKTVGNGLKRHIKIQKKEETPSEMSDAEDSAPSKKEERKRGRKAEQWDRFVDQACQKIRDTRADLAKADEKGWDHNQKTKARNKVAA